VAQSIVTQLPVHLTLSEPNFSVAKWVYQIVQDHTGLTQPFFNF